MICNQPMLVGAGGTVFLLRAGNDPFDGILHLQHGDLLLVPACREKRRFIHQVGQVRSGETGGAAGKHVQIHIAFQGFAFGMDPQDGFAANQIR